ncbi:MAG TPA: OmpH family outer membrane protein [Verrucomicrobiae bacterium]|nr:OmpH family outer membrane protein [Verrucomicrobiae bacterium]
MRNFLRIVLPAALLVAVSGAPAFGQSKIATVDLKKLFENYYKTKLATAAVQQRADELDKDYSTMAADLKKRSDDYQTMLESANDQAVSQDERDRRREAANDELKQLQDSKAAIDQFERQAQIQISDQRQRMRDNILEEIKKAVADKAKAAGDTLVFDSAAQTVNGTPAILFDAGDNDLTADVLKQLNATAPPDLPDATSPPVYVSTNSLPYDLPGSSTPATTPPGMQ